MREKPITFSMAMELKRDKEMWAVGFVIADMEKLGWA